MEEVKAAYRKLVFELHPDYNTKPNADKEFAEVQEAYEKLESGFFLPTDADRKLVMWTMWRAHSWQRSSNGKNIITVWQNMRFTIGKWHSSEGDKPYHVAADLGASKPEFTAQGHGFKTEADAKTWIFHKYIFVKSEGK
jgi:hypothetical protein